MVYMIHIISQNPGGREGNFHKWERGKMTVFILFTWDFMSLSTLYRSYHDG